MPTCDCEALCLCFVYPRFNDALLYLVHRNPAPAARPAAAPPARRRRGNNLDVDNNDDTQDDDGEEDDDLMEEDDVMEHIDQVVQMRERLQHILADDDDDDILNEIRQRRGTGNAQRRRNGRRGVE